MIEPINTTRSPDVEGRSKKIWLSTDRTSCLVELIPSLTSFTYQRHELFPRTAKLRLDFFEAAAHQMNSNGITSVFRRRLGETRYEATWCEGLPFETIVKNFAVGSTVRKYPGLFEEGSRLPRPVVKFDYRVDPEDQPIGEGYLRVLDAPYLEWERKALALNEILQGWLNPYVLQDFCVIFGATKDGEQVITSEVSPDCMRLKNATGESVDKDLFREGAGEDEIVAAWSDLLDGMRR